MYMTSIKCETHPRHESAEGILLSNWQHIYYGDFRRDCRSFTDLSVELYVKVPTVTVWQQLWDYHATCNSMTYVGTERADLTSTAIEERAAVVCYVY